MKRFIYVVSIVLFFFAFFLSGCITNYQSSFTQQEETIYTNPNELIIPVHNSEISNPPSGEKFDVIVIGGEPEGIAAAISASRNGLKTLIIDKHDRIGGLMTVGWLNSIDMNYDPNHTLLNKGIFYEFYQMIDGDSFSIHTAQQAFNQLVDKEDNLKILLNVLDYKPIIQNNRIVGIDIQLEDYKTTLFSQHFIDASQDADIAYQSGVPFTIGQEDYLGNYRSMATTLVFQLGHVEWNKIRRLLQSDAYPHTGANSKSAWGFYEQMTKYTPVDPDIGVRGLNIGRISDDQVLINALYVFGVDGLNKESRKNGIEKAKKELEFIIPFMNANVPGFEEARLVSVAKELYIRETRHMKGLYRLTINDVLENKDFKDRIAFGSYPVDIQSISQTEPGYIVGNPKQYAIPYRSIVPPNIENLLVVGRSASFDSLAHGSARVIPVGMATGQAAGAIAAYSIINDKTFHEIAEQVEDIIKIQDLLNQQGMELNPFSNIDSNINHWAYPGVKFIRSLGMTSAGYNNDYRLEEDLNINQLRLIIHNTNKRLNYPFDYQYEPAVEKKPVDKEIFAKEILLLLNVNKNTSNSYDTLMQLDLLNSKLTNEIENSTTINRAITYMALYELYSNIDSY